jgi:hypothetical protein
MAPPRRSRNTTSSRPFGKLLIFAAGLALLVAWLQFASTMSKPAGGRILTVAEFDHVPIATAAKSDGASSTSLASATPTVQRSHELHVTVAAPVPLSPLLAAEPAVDAPAMCHARAHTELEGGVVVWGSNHKVASAAACCEACRANAAKVKPGANGCNMWVFCADKELCGDRLGQCWLKHTLNPAEPPQRGSGPSVPWTSGTVLPQPAAAYKLATRKRRADRQRADLTMLEAAEVSVGLRNETGTIELLSARFTDSPHVSFPLPLTDIDVRLGGRGEHLDRRPDGYHHLGDLTLRATPRGSSEVTCSSVAHGQVAAAAAAAAEARMGGAVAGGTLSMGSRGALWSHSRDLQLQQIRNRQRASACPVSVTRTITAHAGRSAGDGGPGGGGGVDMVFEIRHPGSAAGGGAPIALEALGLSMPFDQDFVGRNLVQVAHQCSFVEPFLGLGGGYVQVTRATGEGPVLLLLPLDGTSFEAWRPLRNGEDLMRLDFMFEASYELVLHSASYARGEWRTASPWNVPSSATLQPGEVRKYGVRFVLSPSVAEVEATLLRHGMPVAQPLPTPVIHADMGSSTALLVSMPPSLLGTTLSPRSFQVEPSSALTVQSCTPAGLSMGAAARVRCVLVPGTPPPDGRVRLTFDLAATDAAAGGTPSPLAIEAPSSSASSVNVAQGPRRMSVHLFVAEAASRLVKLHGRHGAEKAWMPRGTQDPWHRDGAFFGWDDASGTAVTAERRVYMSGLSDEAGAGAGLAMAVKQVGSPDPDEIAKLEEYVNSTLYQGSHPDRGRFLQSSADHSVRLSQLFWTDELNDPSSAKGRAATAFAPALARVCRSCWPKHCSWMDCWSEEHSLETWRAYNYPHVTAVYWSLYRVARWTTPALTKRADWRWYLTRAHKTAMALWTHGGDPWRKKPDGTCCAAGGGTGTAQWGVMVGSVFELVLSDLIREGWEYQARELQEAVEKRMGVWLKMPFPYGSEFSWDSTGHEEISTWMLRFGKLAEARQTMGAVTAYVSMTPHWAYCGAARRWWDFTINGATMRGNERVLHHYAAALNSIPIYDHALRDPTDGWLWRLAGCAGGGTLTNIRPKDGSASMGWHGDPDLLKRDAYSADFGVGFYGHWKNAGSYLVCAQSIGWLCLHCELTSVRPALALSLSNASACTTATEIRVTPRDGFHRQLYLSPLGVLITIDGASFEHAILTIQEGAPSAAIRLVPNPPTATHATLTLRADGAAPERKLRMRCSAPCGFEPSPFAGDARDVWRMRLGSEAGAILEMSAEK